MGATSPQELLELEANLVKEAAKLEKFSREIYSEQVSANSPTLPFGKSKIVAIVYEVSSPLNFFPFSKKEQGAETKQNKTREQHH